MKKYKKPDPQGAAAKKTAIFVGKYGLDIIVFVLVAAALSVMFWHVFDPGKAYCGVVSAVRCEERETVRLDGRVFRDEEALFCKKGGTVAYFANDNEKVAAKTLLAKVRETGGRDEYLKKKIETEREISLLREIAEKGKTYPGAIEKTAAEAERQYFRVVSKASGGNLLDAVGCADTLLAALCAENMSTGKEKGYAERLRRREGDMEALRKSFSDDGKETYEEIYNGKSAVFSYEVDGFEKIFDTGKLDSLTAKEFEKLCGSEREAPEKGKYPVGKLIKSHKWYFAAVCGADTAKKLEVGKTYEVGFEEGNTLGMRLERNSGTAAEGYLLVFSSGDMPDGFKFKRARTVEVLTEATAGYRVPREALATFEGRTGVYVLSSSEVIFRRVKILKETENYCLAALRDRNAENYGEFLDDNDQIILSVSKGKLYPGRIMD